MGIRYSSLLKIRMLHEYYMKKADGSAVFERATPELRQQFVDEIYGHDRRSVSDDIAFQFPQNLRSSYAALQLKLVPWYSGFQLVTQVKPKRLADGSQVYEPVMPLADDQNIYVLLAKKDGRIDEFSNGRIKREIPGIYFFSNAGNLASPYLTKPIPAYDFSYAYEQGQLASFGANDVRQFYVASGLETWFQLGSSAFANEADRILVPLRFDYTFQDSEGIKNAAFTLKDGKGTTIKNMAVADTGELKKVGLDFSDKAASLLLPPAGSLNNSYFILEVSGTNGYNKSFPLVFGDFFQSGNPWAVIHIMTKPPLAEFHLLHTGNYLLAEPKVFEIPVKSRSGFWRFRNDKGGDLKLLPSHNGYLAKSGKYLVTNRPLPLFQSFNKLKKDDSDETMYVPAPVDWRIVDVKGQMYFDIRVPKAEGRFEVEPL